MVPAHRVVLVPMDLLDGLPLAPQLSGARVAQAVIAWWFSNNLLVVWLGLVGLATIFYFVPKLSNTELHSR